jgi:hypothetical protein
MREEAMRLVVMSVAVATVFSVTARAQERPHLSEQLRERLMTPKPILCDSVVAGDCFAILARRVEYTTTTRSRICDTLSGSIRHECLKSERDLNDFLRR